MTTALRARALLVWALVTAGATGVARLLALDLVGVTTGTGPADRQVETALVAVCEALLLAGTTWAWAATTSVVVGLLREAPARRVPGVPLAWRRLVLLACGSALGVGLAVPAHAASTHTDPVPTGDDHATSGASLLAPRLDGLPLPRRPLDGPTSRGGSPQGPRAADQVVVRPGDTLWAIAAADLGPAAPGAVIARHCDALYRLNAPVIGTDADLVLPGQHLDLPRPSHLGGRP